MKISFEDEITRNATLAQALEPFGEKKGCTTRYVDSSPGTRLEYFVVSAINSSSSVRSFVVDALASADDLVPAFKYAFEAQKESPTFRGGGKVNFGQITLLFPLIAGQVILRKSGMNWRDPKKITDATRRILSKENSANVDHLERFIGLGYSLSARHHASLGVEKEVPLNIFERRYKSVMDAAMDHRHILIVRELADGFPMTLHATETIANTTQADLIKGSEFIYPNLLSRCGRHDRAADILVAAIYLHICASPGALLTC